MHKKENLGEMLNSQENPAAVRSNASHLVEGEDLADMVAIYLFHSLHIKEK